MTTADRTFRHHINCRGAAIEVRCADRCLVLTATGEVDAANADTFVTALTRFAGGPRPVIIDLRPLGFLGTLGLRGLLGFDDKCSRSSTKWVLLAGPATHRLIGIVCPSRTLHIATSVGEAMRELDPPAPAETG